MFLQKSRKNNCEHKYIAVKLITVFKYQVLTLQ